MSLVDNLREMERTREAYWLRHASTSPIKLHWRAVTVRHCFHVLPGESILELGAGSGLWTEHLTSALRAENPVTAAVFNPDYSEQALKRGLANTEVVLLDDLNALPAESFDYVVGTAILCHDRYAENLSHIHRVLKPGGQLRTMFAGLWPGFHSPEVPITSVTNGVHAPTWVAPQVMALAAQEVGTELVEEAQGWEGIEPGAGRPDLGRTPGVRAGLVTDARARVKESWSSAAPPRPSWPGPTRCSTRMSSPSASPAGSRRTSD